MWGIKKIINISLIYTLIGAFLYTDHGYPLANSTLRVPLITSDTAKELREFLNREAGANSTDFQKYANVRQDDFLARYIPIFIELSGGKALEPSQLQEIKEFHAYLGDIEKIHAEYLGDITNRFACNVYNTKIANALDGKFNFKLYKQLLHNLDGYEDFNHHYYIEIVIANFTFILDVAAQRFGTPGIVFIPKQIVEASSRRFLHYVAYQFPPGELPDSFRSLEMVSTRTNAEPVYNIQKPDIKWETRALIYKDKDVTIPPVMKNAIEKALFNTSNGFLKKSISKYLKKEIKEEEINKIEQMEIGLFQIGEYNHIFRVSMLMGDKKVIFGLVVANDPSLNPYTMIDFGNINLLREQLPAFSDLLQNPYALDNSASLSMFSCDWFDDYYELGLDWNEDEKDATLYINDGRISPAEAKLSAKKTSAIIKEISRLLTIFFDEEKRQSIDLDWVEIPAGDFIYNNDTFSPKLKLITVRGIKEDQSIRGFIASLMGFKSYGKVLYDGYGPRASIEFSDYRESVIEGILEGLQDKHGKERGEEIFRLWCNNYPSLQPYEKIPSRVLQTNL